MFDPNCGHRARARAMAAITGGIKQVEFSSISCGDSARGLGQGCFAER